MTFRFVFHFSLVICAQVAVAQVPAPTPSVVYVAHDPAAIKDYKANAVIVRAMVDRLVTAVTHQPDVARAWSSLVSPKDKIGIKISAIGGEIFTTHREIVDAIISGLAAAGHNPGDIVVWDRSIAGAVEAGYKSQRYRLASVAPRDGYDKNLTVSAPILGKLVWGDYDYIAHTAIPLADDENMSNISHVARILSSEVTKIINVPVMSDSETNGIAGCIYNMTVPNLDNWRRFTQGERFGAGALAEVYADPMIAKKVVLNIMDGLIAEYAGGPEAHTNYQVHHATIYASRDPVAVDAIAMRRIDEWRARASLPPLGERAIYVQAAAQLGLGNLNPELRNVGR